MKNSRMLTLFSILMGLSVVSATSGSVFACEHEAHGKKGAHCSECEGEKCKCKHKRKADGNEASKAQTKDQTETSDKQ